jgi:hypothetical protein
VLAEIHAIRLINRANAFVCAMPCWWRLRNFAVHQRPARRGLKTVTAKGFAGCLKNDAEMGVEKRVSGG